MKLKRLIALAMCALMLISLADNVLAESGIELAEPTVVVCNECGAEVGHNEECAVVETEETAEDDTEYVSVNEVVATDILPDDPDVAEIASVKKDTWNINEDKTISNETTLTGNTTWDFTANATVSMMAVVIIPSGKTLTIKGNGNVALIKAAANISDGWMFQVEAGGSLIMNGVTLDGGAVWGDPNSSNEIESTLKRSTNNTGYKNRLIIVNKENTVDEISTFSATDCTFQNAQYGGYIMRFTTGVNAAFVGGKVLNCQVSGEDKTDGVIGITSNHKYKDGTYDVSVRTFSVDGTRFIGCASVTYGGAGGIIRTNGQTSVSMEIKNAVFENNYSGGWGNILWNAIGSCTITDTEFNYNRSARRGGAISSEGENITIENCSFVGNVAGDHGGAICLFPYTLTGKDGLVDEAGIVMNVTIGNGCTFDGNSAKVGGAIAILVQKSDSEKYTTIHGTIDLDDGWMKNNTATEAGGAVYAGATDVGGSGVALNDKSSVILEIKSGSIYSNTAPKAGAIYMDDIRETNTAVNEVLITGGIIGGNGTPNSATTDNGGAIVISDGNMNMSGGTISYNTTTKNGGGVYISGGSFSMTGGTIDHCSATNGGAVYVMGGTCDLAGGVLSNNTATENGGGVFAQNTSSFGLSGTGDTGALICGNHATNGGGIYILQNGDARSVYETKLENGSISGNTATNHGGGIYHSGSKGSCTITGHGAITGNTAKNGGGLYITDGSELHITGGLVYNNKAVGTPASATTAKNDEDNAGVGGGIYVGTGVDVSSKFEMTKTDGSLVGIYGNEADYAASDVFASGSNTSLTIPDVAGMSLTGATFEAEAWYEDYPENDSGYPNNTNNQIQTCTGRYHAGDVEKVALAGGLSVDTGYWCLTLGIAHPGFGQLTIKKAGDTVDENDVFVFQIVGITTGENKTTINFEVTITGTGSVVLPYLPDGEYTITELSGSAWRYDQSVTSEGKVTISDTNPTAEVTFTNTKSDDKWLTDTSAVVKNIYVEGGNNSETP